MRISEFIERSNEAATAPELFSLLQRAGGSVGFDYIAYGALTNHDIYGVAGEKAPAVVLNYPSFWVDHYFEHDYQSSDPVVVYTNRMPLPYTWRHLEEVLELTPYEKTIMDECDAAGLHNGLSIPLHGPFGSTAVVSFASSAPDAEADPHIGWLHALATQFHVAYTRLSVGNRPVHPPIHLSQRERDCLAWSARGKSSWDIGMILGISEHTVTFHIKNAMAKFGTTSRIVAIVQAIRLNLIRP